MIFSNFINFIFPEFKETFNNFTMIYSELLSFCELDSCFPYISSEQVLYFCSYLLFASLLFVSLLRGYILTFLFFYETSSIDSNIVYYLNYIPIISYYIHLKYRILNYITCFIHKVRYFLRATRKVQIIGHKDELNLRLSEKKWHDAGYDVYAKDDIVINGLESKLIDCGMAMEIYPDEMAFAVMRSSYSVLGLFLFNSVLDPGYVGNLKFMIFNTTKEPITILKNNRYLQIVFVTTSPNRRLTQYFPDDKAPLFKTDRGDKGFGSSGK